MANFTINSLSASTPSSADNFLKSDANGVLTKVPFSAIADAVVNKTKTEVVVQENGNVKFTVIVVGKIVVGSMTSMEQTTLTNDGAWHTFANTPQGFPEFHILVLAGSKGQVLVRTTWVNGVEVFQYNCAIPNTAVYYLNNTGAGLTAV